MSSPATEFTWRAVVLGTVLSAVMALANVYLGLKVGLTVSASIPSAVLSMLILRRARNSGVLENNLVQTAASAGESLAAGFVFTIPALVLLGYWQEVAFWPSVIVAVLGGLMGVLCSIPLRRLLIIQEELQFPEGHATAEILKAGHALIGGGDARLVVIGGLLGGLIKLAEGLGHYWAEGIEYSRIFRSNICQHTGVSDSVSGGVLMYAGGYLSPALLGVGYIVGAGVSLTILCGGVVSWLLLLPAYTCLVLPPDAGSSTTALAYAVWREHIRYFGVGAMLFGGMWTLWNLRRQLYQSIAHLRGLGASADTAVQEDISRSVRGMLFFCIVAGMLLFGMTVLDSTLAIVTVGLMLVVFSFLFSLVSGYMAGIVGSSNNPVSGVTMATALIAGLCLRTLFPGLAGIPQAVIFLCAFICCAAAIAGDTLQDLKAGYILGASPRAQQWMQILGVLGAGAVLPLELAVLHREYHLGSPSLVAPQATLVSGIVRGIFEGGLQWNLVFFGGVFGALAGLIDFLGKKRNTAFSFSPLAFAVGMYLPLGLSVTVGFGGVLRQLHKSYHSRQQKSVAESERTIGRGLLTASGLITGEALTGVAIAFAAAYGWANSSVAEQSAYGVCIFLGVSACLVVLPLIRQKVRQE